MPKVQRTPDFLERLAAVERQLGELRRTGRTASEVPFFSARLTSLVYESNAGWATLWETVITPRAATLLLGLALIGDQVGSVNTGGEWQVLIDDANPVASGSVPPTFAFVYPTATIDLMPYRTATQLKISIQVRRTFGATTGGRTGTGGSIGCSPRYARLL
jgi:hypothetical protein